jgi:hypothetical protein
MIQDKTYLVSRMCINAGEADMRRARRETDEVVVQDLCAFCAKNLGIAINKQTHHGTVLRCFETA